MNGLRTIFHANRRYPPKVNPMLATVFLQEGELRYQHHIPNEWVTYCKTTDETADWWENTFTDSEWGEPITVLYRIRVHFHG